MCSRAVAFGHTRQDDRRLETAVKDDYQDHWVKGNVLKEGRREMEERFAMLSTLCDRLPKATVLDIGANAGYFSFRLAATHEYLKVTAVEASDEYFNDLRYLHEMNGLPNVEIRKGFVDPKNPGEYTLMMSMSVFTDPTDMLELKNHADFVVAEIKIDVAPDIRSGLILGETRINKDSTNAIRRVRLFSRHFDKIESVTGAKVVELLRFLDGRCSVRAILDRKMVFIKLQSEAETKIEKEASEKLEKAGIKTPMLIAAYNDILVYEYIYGEFSTINDINEVSAILDKISAIEPGLGYGDARNEHFIKTKNGIYVIDLLEIGRAHV